MNFRVLLLASAALVVMGAPGVMAQAQPVLDEKALSLGYGPGDGPAPTARGDTSLDPEVIANESSEETQKRIAEHFKSVYGSEGGPLAELAEKEKLVEESRKKVAINSMTMEERQQMWAAEAAAKKNGGAQPSSTAPQSSGQPWSVYNRAKSTTKAPPRLFNNVTP
ncbi:MAG: hypothetical protein KKA05_02355 [Alphaproteobacteria bacterium]|nr:hypothetical protein [Alphaproteobacteria bacterium]